jgi:hypothetical protein
LTDSHLDCCGVDGCCGSKAAAVMADAAFYIALPLTIAAMESITSKNMPHGEKWICGAA